MNAKIVRLVIAVGALVAIAAAEPLERGLWLLTKGEHGICTMWSPSHPSAQAQINNCGWIASRARCAAPVTEDGWACQDLLDKLLGEED